MMERASVARKQRRSSPRSRRTALTGDVQYGVGTGLTLPENLDGVCRG